MVGSLFLLKIDNDGLIGSFLLSIVAIATTRVGRFLSLLLAFTLILFFVVYKLPSPDSIDVIRSSVSSCFYESLKWLCSAEAAKVIIRLFFRIDG